MSPIGWKLFIMAEHHEREGQYVFFVFSEIVEFKRTTEGQKKVSKVRSADMGRIEIDIYS